MALECSGGGTAYQLTDHACRHCGGRVLQAGDTFRCASCAAVTLGSPEGICGCGVLASWGTRPPRKKEPKQPTTPPQTMTRWKGPRPFKCAANPSKSDKSPAEIVITFGTAA